MWSIKNWLQKKGLSIRVIFAVAAGIIISKVLMVITHILLHQLNIFYQLGAAMFDTDLVLIALGFHSLFAVIAAFFTAWIAGDEARKATFILGSKEAILWLAGIILLWHHSPAWFNLTKAILGIPLAIFGGWIYEKNKPENR